MSNVDVTRIASNIGALNALNALQQINSKLALHQTRLSTGKRINSAGEDPAGLTIATKMLARSEGLKVALSNIGDASNMLSVAESGLSKMNDILLQMRNKAEQAASDTLGQTERQAIQTQLSAYAAQIDAIVDETKWNNTLLLDGNISKRFQTGVDDGEFTLWSLSQDHSAEAGLGISENVEDNSITNVSTAAKGVTGITVNQTTLGNFTALASGAYGVKIVASADSADIGSLVSNSGVLNAGVVNNAFTLSSTDPVAAELANGIHNLAFKDFDNVDGDGNSTIKYSLDGGVTYSADTNLVGDITSEDVTLEIAGGVTLTIDGGTADLAAEQTARIDYLKAGFAKARLQNADGATQTVYANGGSSAYFYLDGVGGGNTDTGRGLSVEGDTWANMDAQVDQTTTFKYIAANAYYVDLSSAEVASSYMSVVNSAMDTVNNSMASLGSLMARLDFKSEQVAIAQVNVEGAYSRIMNANMAEEQMNASKYTILQQTAVAMLAQANQAPQSLLALFR